jgi:hypothetical protein
MKEQHQMELCLLCLQRDECSREYSIPSKPNPIIGTILKTGMRAAGTMTINRALARFTPHSRMLNDQHAAPFAIKQWYNKQVWILFLHSAWFTSTSSSIEMGIFHWHHGNPLYPSWWWGNDLGQQDGNVPGKQPWFWWQGLSCATRGNFLKEEASFLVGSSDDSWG